MNPLAGPLLFFEALTLLLRSPKLWLPSLLPAFAGLALSAVGMVCAFTYGDELIALIPQLNEGGWLMELLLSSALSVVVLLLTPWLVMLVGFPLCEPLIGRADAILGGEEVEIGALQSILRSLTVGVMITVIGIGGALALTLISFFPLLGPFVLPFQLLLWTPAFAAFDACDGLFGRRQLTLRARLAALWRAPLNTMSVGLVVMALISVPILNMIGLPIAALIGTLYARSRVDAISRERRYVR
ncbi:MAG: EI24 domain-containing protein [Myxococcota bacterium]|nr:EI24 domain-containing protein [Myxococcota bacterium]